MPKIFLLATSSVVISTLLGSCSNSQDATTTGSPATEAPVTSAGHVSRVDSLNGIPGHQFGEPLSAFPGLVPTPGQQPGTQTYSYPATKPEGGWFGKHKSNVSSFYIFLDGKFQGFQAIAFGPGRAALQEETSFLLGRGKQNIDNTYWGGQKATAWYTIQVLPKGPAEILNIQSLSLTNAQASESTERLKRENTVQ